MALLSRRGGSLSVARCTNNSATHQLKTPTALPRSSIIISDELLSGETNYRTEFVAVLNNQPQGGFVTRRPTADVAVASGNFWGDDGLGSLFQPNWNSQTGNTRYCAGPLGG